MNVGIAMGLYRQPQTKNFETKYKFQATFGTTIKTGCTLIFSATANFNSGKNKAFYLVIS